MKVLLIDADSTIPNLALMRLSTWYKNIGASVELLRLNIPYYPSKKKKMCMVNTTGYDLSFCSCVFEGTREYVCGDGIQFGGTGVSLDIQLDREIENCAPDYSIYPDCDYSIGFISRGCIRKCKFCKVPIKEGGLRQVSTPQEIIKHKSVKFLDNNFLALPNHKDILNELITSQVKCEFNQGLDMRLLDIENSLLLYELNYRGEYTFAFDDISQYRIIETKLPLLSWRKPWQIRMFTYINPEMDLENFVLRINYMREQKILPYVMRDISCWGSDISDFATDLASWCNQPGLFKNMEFHSFLGKRHKNKDRIIDSARKWNFSVVSGIF